MTAHVCNYCGVTVPDYRYSSPTSIFNSGYLWQNQSFYAFTEHNFFYRLCDTCDEQQWPTMHPTSITREEPALTASEVVG